MEVGVSDVPRCINDVPKYLVLKSLNDVSVAPFRVPHSCMPSVHTGFSICLCSISLVCIDRADLLPMRYYIFLYFIPSSSRFFLTYTMQMSGPGSSVGIATDYGLDGPGMESRWGRDFPHLSTPDLEPTQPPERWVTGFSRGKERPGRDADPSPLPVPWSRKSRVIPPLALWAARPVQSLSAYTRVHFIFTLQCK